MKSGKASARRCVIFCALFFSSGFLLAAYTANTTGAVSWVKIYNTDTIYFQLQSMPSDHQCSTNYFVLASSITSDQRDRYFSMLLAAKMSGAKVSVGYDKNGTCQNNSPLVYALSIQ
ncbi:MAG: hypothetical protein MK096_15080 [Oleiphilaceae bacterium]|nr:hypothetical protein [Oleiphilaceae bacterium]